MRVAPLICVMWCLTPPLQASDLDEFKVKRQRVFEFTQRPRLDRDGDKVAITFTSKAYCDATVAIENAEGKIIRHLASGVLGKNAPKPFQKNSLKQTLVWDGKDDQGQYVDDKGNTAVRVSLGLKPRFEKTLWWSPHKRTASMPVICAAPEGVYVFDGYAVDHVRLFDHQGAYLRTIYPFPANKVKDVAGLRWHRFPQGYRRPLKESLYQQTLLTCGDNDDPQGIGGQRGVAATGMAVRGKRLALAYEHLNRLATDGSSGGLALKGPRTGVIIRIGKRPIDKKIVGPTSLAFSPDGKTLYLTGYLWRQRYGEKSGCIHGVFSLDFERGTELKVFAGSRDRKVHGTDTAHFRVPTSVACDRAGNVYVSDFVNDRVQIFSPGGRILKTIRTPKPAKVLVHQKTGEIFVLSWRAFGVPFELQRQFNYDPARTKIQTTLTRFSPFPEAKRISTEPFQLGRAGIGSWYGATLARGPLYQVELDSWAPGPGPVFWVVGRRYVTSSMDYQGIPEHAVYYDTKILEMTSGIRIMKKTGGKWGAAASFRNTARKRVRRITPLKWNIQQLYVNPVTGKLYVGEADSGTTWKAFKVLVEIDPETGAQRLVDLPFNAMDAAFDLNGLIYLRSLDVVARYDPQTWREVPWDYGEELKGVSCGIQGKSASVISGLVVPTVSPVCFHQGGMSVSPKRHLAVAAGNRPKGRLKLRRFRTGYFGKPGVFGKPYRPALFPGREESSTSCSVHVFDKHGKLLYEDAIPGLCQIDGVHIDKDDNLYVMATGTRIHDGEVYFNKLSSTLMKFRPGRGRFINPNPRWPVPLPASARPKRSPEIYRDGDRIWVDGADWLYGGVGFAAFCPHGAGGCACWFARFSVDYFARSFAPEPYQYSVAVLDANGNLITRVGKYGNVDDGEPLDPKGGPPTTRSIGGDEVGLFHADFVGVHSDRRLFIADLGNARIVSVKLGYHATAMVSLRNVPNSAER